MRLARNRLCHIALMTTLFSFALASVFAQGSDGAEVIEKYLEAIGGREKLETIRTQVSKGTFSMPDMGMFAPMEVYVKAPDRLYSLIDIAEFGSASSGVLEDIAWDVNPMMGPRVLKGGERQSALRRAQINEFLRWKKNFTSVEVAEELQIGSELCIQLILTPPEGSPMKAYFSQSTGLLQRIQTSEGGQSMQADFLEYKDFNGIKMARFSEISSPQFRFEIELETVEHNVDIPFEKFDLPPEIKSLLP